jgi:hypothetical protein
LFFLLGTFRYCFVMLKPLNFICQEVLSSILTLTEWLWLKLTQQLLVEFVYCAFIKLTVGARAWLSLIL